MKKSIILLTLASALIASETSDKLKAKILEKILTEISINKEKKIWSDDTTVLNAFRKNTNLNVTDNCMKSTIIILKDKKSLNSMCCSKHIFVLRYDLLSKVPQSFGSFFWKKGRPNIVLIKQRLKKQNIKASDKLNPYLEDKVW